MSGSAGTGKYQAYLQGEYALLVQIGTDLGCRLLRGKSVMHSTI